MNDDFQGPQRNSSDGDLTDVLRRPVWHHPDKVAYRFLDFAGAPPAVATYAAMDAWARQVAAQLTSGGWRGQRALLAFDPGLEFIAAFLGCLYAGVTAVPVYPPDPFRLHRTLERLQKIVHDAQVKLLLTTEQLAPMCQVMMQPGALRQTLCIGPFAPLQQPFALDGDWQPPQLAGDQLALLQYTSGSTGDPKGVMVTRDNLRHNMAQIHRRLVHDNPSTACWLPVYHDMGLLAGVLQPWRSGDTSVLMSPLAFFQQPLRWLQVISDYRITTAVSPDFGYDVCVRKTTPAERASLDLRHWRIAMNGSEPVRASTIARFVEAFAPCGLRPDVFMPCYGLAEATLFVAGSDIASPPFRRDFDAEALRHGHAVAAMPDRPARRLVASGRSVDQQQLLIVDARSCYIQNENTVGEIWLAGPHIARGYWKQQQATEHTFNAFTADGQGPFLRTGDLGFLHDGQLFVTGRMKDVLIVCGRNYYPQDIERTVEACDAALKPHGGAVFAADDGQYERIIVVHEVLRPNRVDLDGLTAKVAATIEAEHQIPVDTVVLIKAGTLPKTTSGKTRRGRCRELYLAGQLASVAIWSADRNRLAHDAPVDNYVAPTTMTEEIVAEVWGEVLGLPRVSIHDHFLDLGGNSLLAAQVAERLAHWLPDAIPLSTLFDQPTVAEMAAWIDRLPASHSGHTLIADLLSDLDNLSEEEAERRLNDERQFS